MENISEKLCKISTQRQDNHNDYYFYPSSEKLFKQEAFDDKLVIVQVFDANKKLIDEIEINVTTYWKSSVSTQIRTTTRYGIDISKKYNDSKIIAFPKRYQNRFNINDFFKNNKYWIYAAGEKSYKWNEFFTDGIMAIGWDYLGDLTKYSSEEQIADKIIQKENPDKYPMNNRKANWEFANKMQIGDIVYVKQGLKDALIGRGIVQSDYIFDDSRSEYKSIRKVLWTHNGIYNVDFSQLNIKQWNQKTLTDISEDKYKDFCLKIEDIFMNNSQGTQNDIIPLNQILYGPPGTGKTYNTVIKAMEIINPNCIEYNEKGDVSNYLDVKKEFDKAKDNHQIEFVTFHQSYSYEEFVEGIKPDLSSDDLKYELNEGIFKRICEHAETKYSDNFDEIYAKFLDEINSVEGLYKLKTRKNKKDFGLEINSNNNLNIFMGNDFHKQGTLTKENIQKHFLQTRTKKDWSGYYDGIIDYLRDKYNLKKQDKKVQPHILIIDEINRGDVSKIFGELITLIEEDKRIGNKYQMKITLPYSKEPFGVPNNLYIIGTMNTADRSIALLDTALRRRFDFEEIMPRPELLCGKVVEGINLQTLLTKINERITNKYDRDHQIGHSYLMGVDTKEQLKRAYKNRILPLLNEYFYNESKIVAEILNCSEKELETSDFVYILDKAQQDK